MKLFIGSKGSQYENEPEIFDFETEARWRAKRRKGYVGNYAGYSKCISCRESTSPIKTVNKPGKLLEFKRNE